MSAQSLLRIVFLGTPHFSVPSLKVLAADPRIEIIGVITQPDRPAGRGQKLTPPPVKETAQALGLTVFQTESIRKDESLKQWLREQQPDYMVTVAFGQILTQEILDIPRLGTVNLHASLLPEYRGANPIQQAMLDGKTTTGLTTMLTERGVDTGPMLLTWETPIGEQETMGELTQRLSDAGGSLLAETLAAYASGTLQARPQDHERATHAPKFDKADAELDWTLPTEVLHRRVRAYNPMPGAFTFWQGERMKIHETRIFEPASLPHSEEKLKAAPPGTVFAIIKEAVIVTCGDRALQLISVQPAGKKPTPAMAWVQTLGYGPGGGAIELGRFCSEIPVAGA